MSEPILAADYEIRHWCILSCITTSVEQKTVCYIEKSLCQGLVWRHLYAIYLWCMGYKMASLAFKK